MRWMIIMLTVATLAGCADTPETEPTEDIDVPDAETSDTLGAIAGVIVDETIVPIADALVSIGSAETTSDENGAFVFEGLEPNTYFISATAEGFEKAQTSVVVVAGEVAKARLLLTADLSPVPTKITDKFDAWMEFSDFYVVYILTDVIGPNDLCKCKFETAKQDNLQTVILEAEWTSSMQRVDGHSMWWDTFSDNSGWQSGWDSSPTYMRHEGGAFGADDENLFVLVSSDLQPDVGQAIEIFLTQFSNAPAPEGWSLIEGSE